MEDYGFDYSDDDTEQEDVDIENQYYNSKGAPKTFVPVTTIYYFLSAAGMLENGNVDCAMKGFASIISMELEKGEWGFRALKQCVMVHFKAGNFEQMMKTYHELLTYVKTAVTRNYSEKVINYILDSVSSSSNQAFLQDFYESTLFSLEEAKNERLWFKTNLKLCKLWFELRNFSRMKNVLRELHRSCQHIDGSADQRKGTQLLEVFAIEIQMYTEQKNNKKLKILYQRALTIKSAIPHPRILGIIRECGGKMHMAERQWEKAATDFFEAFKSYDEAGQPRRVQCLKYLVLANMLMGSEVNPFDAQEARPFKSEPEIMVITTLVTAYQRNSISDFEDILRAHQDKLVEDTFIREYIEDLLKNIRTQVLLNIIQPYTKIHIPFISGKLRIRESDVESLLVSLVLDSRIHAQIDQTSQLVELKADPSRCSESEFRGTKGWTASIKEQLNVFV